MIDGNDPVGAGRGSGNGWNFLTARGFGLIVLVDAPPNHTFMKHFLRRYLPDPHYFRSHKRLRFLGEWLHDPQLWHFGRRSTVLGLAVGVFFAFIPFPWQSALAAAAAIWLRFNLPVAAAMVWITNPLTMPPIFYLTYRLGAWILGQPRQKWDFEPTLHWLLHKAGDIVLPLLVGSLITAVVAGGLTFCIAHLCWRWYIISKFRRRRRVIPRGLTGQVGQKL